MMRASAPLPDELHRESPTRSMHLPVATIAKVLLTLAAIWALYKLGTVIAVVLVAVVLAISLEPIVGWLEDRRVPRWVGSTLVVLVIVGLLIVFFAFCGSSLATQGRQLASSLSSAQQDLAAHLPPPFDRIL